MMKDNAVVHFLKGYGRLTIFMIPIGIAINIVGGQIAILLKLPMYLDSVGTILIGALCGCWPGAAVGTISNLLNAITAPTAAPYTLLSIMFGLLAGYLSRLGVFRVLWKTLLSAIPFSLIGGVMGACITLALFGGFSGQGTDFITTSFVAAGIPINGAVFLAAVPVDLIDKIPTVVLVYLIIGRISKRLMSKMPLGYVYLGRPGQTTTAKVSPARTSDEAGIQ